jgi:hypothetical protein
MDEFHAYQSSCDEAIEPIFSAQAYNGNGNYYERKAKATSDILTLCRASYGYGNMACGELEGFYQNKHKQKQLLSMMKQRIDNFNK